MKPKNVMNQIERLRYRIKIYTETPSPRDCHEDYRKRLATSARLYEIDKELSGLSNEDAAEDEYTKEKISQLADEINKLTT